MSPRPIGRSRAPIDLAPDVRVGQLVVVEHDVGVVGADVLGHVVHVRGVRGRRSSSAWKFSAWPTKSTAKVRTGSLSSRAASAVMALESRPPDSSTHRGTSATSWRWTMSSSSSRTRATVVSRSSVCGLVSSASRCARGRRALDGDDGARLDLAHALPHRVPGRLDRDDHLAQSVDVDDRLASGLARIALGSEPNSTPSGVG